MFSHSKICWVWKKLNSKSTLTDLSDLFSLLYFKFLISDEHANRHKNILPQYPSWIHPGKFPGENEAYKISPRWNRFGFSTSPVCIGNLSHPERNFELLIFPSEFLKFCYFPGDIAQTVIGPWLTSVSFKIYTGYK